MFQIIKNPSILINLIKDGLSEHYEDFDLVVIYGSVSENNMTAESDLDIFIIGKMKIKDKIWEIISDIVIEFGLGFDMIYVTPTEARIVLSNPLLKKAIEEGTIIWEKKKIEPT